MAYTERLEQKVKAVRLYSVTKNAAEVERQLLQEYGENALDRRSIGRINKQFDETGSVLPKKHSGRPRSITTKENEDALSEILVNNGDEPMSSRRLSQVCHLSHTSTYRLLKELKCKPYIPRLIHALSEDDFDRRVETCDLLLSMIDRDPDFVNNILWSDEAQFKLSGTVNRHNCVIWSLQNPHFTVYKQCQAPGLMVWCGICSSGIVGPVFIDGNLNGDKYLALLRQHVFPIENENMWFMQDGCPSHYATNVRNELDQHFRNRWIGRRGYVEWAPRSPDLTPCDFFLWGFLKDKVFARRPRSLADLRNYITEEVSNISPEICRTVCQSVSSRFRTCIAKEGKQFEQDR